MNKCEMENTEQSQLYQLILKANREQTHEIKTELQTVKLSFTQKLKETHDEVNILKEKCTELDRKIRKNNLLIFGIDIRNQENILDECLEILNTNLDCDIQNSDINNIYKLGTQKKAPVVIEFVSYLKKNILFKNLENLKKLNKFGITIQNDMTKEDRDTSKILKKHQKLARAQNIEAKIKGYKLIIDGVAYSANELEGKLQVIEESAGESEEEVTPNETEEVQGTTAHSNDNDNRSKKRSAKDIKEKTSRVNTRYITKKIK